MIITSFNPSTQDLEKTYLTQYHASGLSSITVKNNQGFVVTLPRVTYTSGSPTAGAQNQDVMVPLSFMASIDTTTNCQIQFDRLEYYEV